MTDGEAPPIDELGEVFTHRGYEFRRDEASVWLCRAPGGGAWFLAGPTIAAVLNDVHSRSDPQVVVEGATYTKCGSYWHGPDGWVGTRVDVLVERIYELELGHAA